MLWRCPNHWAMVVRWVDDGTEVAMRCSFYQAVAAVLPSCHCPVSAAATMLSRGDTSASGASKSLQELVPLSFLVISLDPFWQPPSSYAELCPSNFLEIPGANSLLSNHLLCIWNAWVEPFMHTLWAPSRDGCGAATKPLPSGLAAALLPSQCHAMALTPLPGSTPTTPQ